MENTDDRDDHLHLKNPAYAGAFVYGRNSHTTTRGPNGSVVKTKRLPMEKWRILIKDKYPAYVVGRPSRGFRGCSRTTTPSMSVSDDSRHPPGGQGALAGLVYCGGSAPTRWRFAAGSAALPLRLPPSGATGDGPARTSPANRWTTRWRKRYTEAISPVGWISTRRRWSPARRWPRPPSMHASSNSSA